MWEFQLYILVFGLLGTHNVSGFYYGKNTGVTQVAAQSFCQSIGLRLAVLETLAEYEDARAFLQKYHGLWGKGDHPWIGLERDLSATTHTYKWIDGNPLAYASFGTHPWRDETTPADDLSKTCIRLDWGPGLLFKPDACNQTKDFLCEGFHLVISSVTWGTAKSGCEANNMKLASLPNLDAHTAASQFINVKRAIASTSWWRVWFGMRCTSGNTYFYEDGTEVLTYGSSYNTLPWNSGDPGGCMCGRLKRYDYNNAGFYKWTDKECYNTYPYLCIDEFLPINITTLPAPTTTTAIPETTTKPWWFVEYSEDGKALGKNGMTFDKSTPPARFGFIGMAIGFGVFSFIIAVICMLWFCCIRSKADYSAHEDSDDEEEKEKRNKMAFTAISAKPHGLQYIA
uniref:C-type lectin domain-containing protein n=1 Tax=Magallana gigas TaxID=29159 RepID=A0A8W8MDD6_MAGGI|nr:uncharacterized protein LOC109619000 isoform X3 [Crassostrea gigas]